MRQGIQILAVALLLAVIGLFAYRFLFPDESPSLLVRSSQRATLRDADGVTRTLAEGDVVSVGDRVLTADGGSAELTSGESEVSLRSGSSMLIKRLDETGIEVEIDGQLSAHVRHTPLRVLNEGRSVYATDADFALAADGGTVAVDTTRGQVALEGFGDVASANAGERVTAAKGAGAVKSAIPTSLLLEVAWPEERETRSATVSVHGRTDPYAKVTVGRGGAWQEVRADADGTFTADVILEEGANPVEVRARSPMGQEERARADITRKSTGPSGEATVDFHGR
jgi:hypothetical protein